MKLIRMCDSSFRSSRLGGLAVVILLAASVGFSQTKEDFSPAFNTVTYSENSWVEYKPPGGRFSVLLPGKPAEQVQPYESAFGRKNMQISVLLVQTGESYAVCLTGYSDFPISFIDPAAIKMALDAGRDELLRDKSLRKLIIERDIRLDSHLGRELTFEDGDVLMVQRLFIVNNRLFQVTVGTAKGSKDELVEKIRQKVLDSYKLLTAAKDSKDVKASESS